MIYVCQNAPDCEWRLRGNRTSEDDIKVTVRGPVHTCIAGFEMRSVSSTVAWLLNRIPQHLQFTKQTTPAAIIETFLCRAVSYYVANYSYLTEFLFSVNCVLFFFFCSLYIDSAQCHATG